MVSKRHVIGSVLASSVTTGVVGAGLMLGSYHGLAWTVAPFVFYQAPVAALAAGQLVWSQSNKASSGDPAAAVRVTANLINGAFWGSGLCALLGAYVGFRGFISLVLVPLYALSLVVFGTLLGAAVAAIYCYYVDGKPSPPSRQVPAARGGVANRDDSNDVATSMSRNARNATHADTPHEVASQGGTDHADGLGQEAPSRQTTAASTESISLTPRGVSAPVATQWGRNVSLPSNGDVQVLVDPTLPVARIEPLNIPGRLPPSAVLPISVAGSANSRANSLPEATSDHCGLTGGTPASADATEASGHEGEASQPDLDTLNGLYVHGDRSDTRQYAESLRATKAILLAEGRELRAICQSHIIARPSF